MTEQTISRKHLIAACERWVALSPQKRCALLRKLGTDGAISYRVTGKVDVVSVQFKQRSIVVVKLAIGDNGALMEHRWCYRRES